MTYTAIKIPVIESEKGWGQRVDDHMICLSSTIANAFVVEFNSKNNEPQTPDWYMYADNYHAPIEITEAQFNHINNQPEKREWLSKLKKI